MNATMTRTHSLRLFAGTLAAGVVATCRVAQAATAVTVLQGTESLLYAPIYIARAKNYFTDEGIAVDVVIAGGGSQALAALIGGSGQVAAAAFSNNVEAALKGRPMVAFAALMDQYANDLVIRKDVAAKKGVGPKTPLMAKIKALSGLKIGITAAGSATDDTVRWLVRQAGLDPDRDIEIVPLKEESTALGAIKQGAIDAMLFPSPAPDRAIADGTAISLVNFARGEVPALRGYLFITLMATRAWLDANAPVATGMTRAIARAETMLQRDPAQAKATLRPFFSGMDDATFDLSFQANLPAYAPTPEITQGGFKAVLDFMGKPGSPPVSLPFDQVATNKYVSGTKKR